MTDQSSAVDRGPAVIEADVAAVSIDGAVLLSPTSLALECGEIVAVLGPNGAGKTTLLRVLAGRTRPTSGAALLHGEPLDERRARVRGEIAALIEAPVLYPDLTILDHLELIETAWAGERGRDLAPGLGASALQVFGIDALRDRFPHELSSGQRQLVSLAATFARPADVLLLDEPEQRLDPDRRALVAEALLAARGRGATIAFASHDAALVARVADRSLRVGA